MQYIFSIGYETCLPFSYPINRQNKQIEIFLKIPEVAYHHKFRKAIFVILNCKVFVIKQEIFSILKYSSIRATSEDHELDITRLKNCWERYTAYLKRSLPILTYWSVTPLQTRYIYIYI